MRPGAAVAAERRSGAARAVRVVWPALIGPEIRSIAWPAALDQATASIPLGRSWLTKDWASRGLPKGPTSNRAEPPTRATQDCMPLSKAGARPRSRRNSPAMLACVILPATCTQ